MSRLEKWLPWIFFTGFASLLMLDSSLWHPGFSFFDEGLGSVATIQLWFEGSRLPFELFKGCVHRDLAAFVMAVFGKNLEVWRSFTLLAVGLECLLLYQLAKRYLDSRAGVWAVCLNLATAMTFLRARSLLSYSILPLELLLLVWLIPKARRPWVALLLGAAAALLLADYEGWIFALPVLALAWKREKLGISAMLIGFTATLASLLWISWDGLHSHLLLRSRSLPHSALKVLFESLRSFFWGGETFGYMGVAWHSVFPIWALPALALGFFKAPRWLWVWVLLGLIPMFFVGTAAEPNRLMVAWPALCLLSGFGFALIPRKLTLILVAGLLLGAGLEARAYVSSMRSQYANYYGGSALLMHSAKRARITTPDGVEFISELDYETSAAERFVWTAYGPPKKQGLSLALIPWDYAIAVKPMPVEGELYKPDRKLARRLKAIELELMALRRDLPLFNQIKRREALLTYLREHKQADPWVRTAVIEGALGLSFMIGDLPKELLQAVLEGKLSSAASYAWLAEKSKAADPKFSAYLSERARRKDPRR